MNTLSKTLIISGLLLILCGLIWHFVGRWTPLGRLPGDILIKRRNFQFYFPLATCLLLSAIFSLVSYLIAHFRK